MMSKDYSPERTFIQPTTPFEKLLDEGVDCDEEQFNQIMKLNKDQLRWALWTTLSMVFGCPLSNAEAVLVYGEGQETCIKEAKLLLMQLALPPAWEEDIADYASEIRDSKGLN